jgi:membrane fusion protein, copper/silver efflux system
MTNQRPTTRRLVWIASLGWVLGSFSLFFILFFDPLDIHPVDRWLQHAVGYSSSSMAGPQVGAGRGEILFYRSPMDPTITSPVLTQDEMGMDYIPVYADGGGKAGAEDREILFYRNPMDPTITSPVFTQDEMGMDYIPVYGDEAGQAIGRGTTVTIDPAVVQNMNVLSELVERRDISHDIRTVGYLDYDQERMVSVTTKYTGWVEKVYVNYIGEPVRRGQALFEIYSPELVQTQQEFLSALSYARKFGGAHEDAKRRAEGLVDAARTRLGYWDISPSQIATLEETGEVLRTLTAVSPASGVVMERMPGLEGMAVKPGMEIFHIANLSSLWLSVEIFEDQVAWVREGTPAEVNFTYFPGETFHGKVRYLEPEFSEKTRTLRAKLEVPNPDGRLRAGMFATVAFKPVAAAAVVAVPSLAILRTGQRNVVVVDLGGGRFAPREVTLGHEAGRYAEVLDGIEVGERVVTSAQFLLDSEASLQEAIQRMINQTQQEKSEAEEQRGVPLEVPKTSSHEEHGHAQ